MDPHEPSELAPGTGLTALELASGFPGGEAEAAAPLPPAPAGLEPLAALERAILPALRRGPCFVSFSGGRDSSAVLAAATSAARREGHPDPVPISQRFPDAPDSEESAWQERVVAHLGLRDWLRLELADELDYVGPVARRALGRHGVLYPFNAHFHVPMLELAAGGTLLTGYGGDDVLLAWRWQSEALVLSLRERPRLRGLPRLGYFLAPLPARRAVASRATMARPWLTELGQRLFRQAIAREADEPRRFDMRVRWLARRRYLDLAARSKDLLAAEANAAVENPLLDHAFLAAVARAGGRFGPGDRTAAMRRFFSQVLPGDVLARPTKASFGDVFFREPSKRFLREWDGTTPFPELVDPEGMRGAWAGGDTRTPRLLLQATWLAAERRGGAPALT
jgi:asparagine synthase (glutamine-hydrolysing)